MFFFSGIIIYFGTFLYYFLYFFSFLNTFSSSFLESLQIIERTNFFSKRYEIFYTYLKKRKKYFFHPFNY